MYEHVTFRQDGPRGEVYKIVGWHKEEQKWELVTYMAPNNKRLGTNEEFERSNPPRFNFDMQAMDAAAQEGPSMAVQQLGTEVHQRPNLPNADKPSQAAAVGPPVPPLSSSANNGQSGSHHGVKVIGFPSKKPTVDNYMNGWRYESHEYVLKELLHDRPVRCVIEIGSFYGLTTQYLAKMAPKAQIFAIDRWDPVYVNTEQSGQYLPGELTNLFRYPMLQTFLLNLWDAQERVDPTLKEPGADNLDNCVVGVTPVQGDSCEAMHFLHKSGVVPDVVFVDGDHAYEGTNRDLETIIKLWGLPFDEETQEQRYTIVGGGFEHVNGTRVAVKHLGQKFDMPIYLDTGQAWSYTPVNKRRLATLEVITDVKSDIIKQQFEALIEMVSKRGADPSMLHWRLQKGGPSYGARNYLNHFTKQSGKNLLMVAAENGNHAICRALICDYNVNPNAKNFLKGTALHNAAYNGHARVVAVLIELGADKTMENKWGETAIKAAMSNGHKDLANMLENYTPAQWGKQFSSNRVSKKRPRPSAAGRQSASEKKNEEKNQDTGSSTTTLSSSAMVAQADPPKKKRASATRKAPKSKLRKKLKNSVASSSCEKTES